MPKKATDVEITKCNRCGSKMFVSWGFELAITPAHYKLNARGGESRYADHVQMYPVRACAHCKTAYYVDEGELVDASELISAEEVQHALEVLGGSPGAKARTIDP